MGLAYKLWWTGGGEGGGGGREVNLKILQSEKRFFLHFRYLEAMCRSHKVSIQKG